jgi:hypothetical protein
VGNLDISINSTPTTGFTTDSRFGDQPSADISNVLTSGIIGDHTVMVNSAGDLSPDSPGPGNLSAINSEKLIDIMLYLKYGVLLMQ